MKTPFYQYAQNLFKPIRAGCAIGIVGCFFSIRAVPANHVAYTNLFGNVGTDKKNLDYVLSILFLDWLKFHYLPVIFHQKSRFHQMKDYH